MDGLDKNTILKNLKDNKILIKLNKLLKKSDFGFNIDNLDEMRQLINLENISYNEKTEMLGLLEQIDNTLHIINNENVRYKDYVELAENELLYDKDLSDKDKTILKQLIDKFIKSYIENLHLKDGMLFGYDYNIMTFSWFSKNIRLYSNQIFAFILKLISAWLIFAKPIGSPLLIVKYIMTQDNGVKNLINNMSGGSKIWKYFSMGLDSSYFEDIYKNMNNNKEETIIEKGTNILYSVLIFLLLIPIFMFYNNANFGLLFTPSWYNIIYQIIFISNIFGNIYTKSNNGSLLLFNVKFLIGFIILMLIVVFILYIVSLIKK